MSYEKKHKEDVRNAAIKWLESEEGTSLIADTLGHRDGYDAVPEWYRDQAEAFIRDLGFKMEKIDG